MPPDLDPAPRPAPEPEPRRYCLACGDPATSTRHPGYCAGCAIDIDDPTTTPGGYSS